MEIDNRDSQSQAICDVFCSKSTSQLLTTKLNDYGYFQNYSKFFKILIKQSSEQLVRQLENFLTEHKYYDKLIIKNILFDCNLHNRPDIINEILFNITKYKNIYDILNIIYILLEFGADINLKIDFNNNTLLHKASFEGNKCICLQLIKLGSNTSLLNLSNETPLDRFGKILDRSLMRFTNTYKLECCSLFTKEANWIRRRNYILLIHAVKKLFMNGYMIKPFTYKFIMCHDVIWYVASFL